MRSSDNARAERSLVITGTVVAASVAEAIRLERREPLGTFIWAKGSTGLDRAGSTRVSNPRAGLSSRRESSVSADCNSVNFSTAPRPCEDTNTEGSSA